MNKKQIVLIVDDTPENLQLLGHMLESQGYEVLVATNGPDALENAGAIPSPDLILLDIMMPDMDGYEVCRRLKADPGTKRIPVIFISALGMPDQKIQGFIEGGVDYITKPFQAEEVLARVHTHLQLIQVEELKHEIDERKRVEAEKLLIEEHLRQAQKMEAIGTLAGGIAHDFNNILSAIVGYTDIALLHGPDEYEAIQADLHQIALAADRAADLVKQILTFSRQSKQEKMPIKISAVVKEALKLLSASFPATIEIRQEINSTFSVMADPTQIHQIVMNLCTNAYQAMIERGGVMIVILKDVSIDVSKQNHDNDLASGKYVMLSVQDNGFGMNNETISRIFDPYFTTKEIGKGTGLGLAMVQGIVNDHQGRIKVQSEPGKGSVFDIFLPAITSKAHLDIVEEAPPMSFSHEHIMFVDDDNAIQKIISRILITAGYRVDVYANGFDALEAFSKSPNDWNILISDQTMPKMTGTQLAYKISEIRTDLPVILCSGFDMAFNDEYKLQTGYISFLQKPITRNALLTHVAEILEKYRNSRI